MASETTFKNTIGMYTAETATQGSYYLLWMQFVPYFVHDMNEDGDNADEGDNETGASWCKFKHN